MSWPFCPQCGSILDPPAGDHVSCDFCDFTCDFGSMNSNEIVTKSAAKAKPAWLVDELDLQEAEVAANSGSAAAQEENGGSTAGPRGKKHAVIAEPCPKCNHPEQYFYTMQLRSVDEGSTVFYECPKCGNKYTVNN